MGQYLTVEHTPGSYDSPAHNTILCVWQAVYDLFTIVSNSYEKCLIYINCTCRGGSVFQNVYLACALWVVLAQDGFQVA